MIVNDFYPTDPNATDSATGIECTAEIADITPQTFNIADPYYMGYMDSTYMSANARLSSFIVSIDSGSSDWGITFTDLTPKNQYIPWFFTSHYSSSATANTPLTHYTYSENEWNKFLIASTISVSANIRFFNSFDIRTVQISQPIIKISWLRDLSPRRTASNFTHSTKTLTELYTPTDLFNFLYNDGEITFNVFSNNSYTPSSVDVTLKFSDFDTQNGTCTKTWEVYDNTYSTARTLSCILFISAIEKHTNRAKNEQGTLSVYPNPSIAYKYDNFISVLGTGHIGEPSIGISTSTFLPDSNDIKTVTFDGVNYIPGGFVGKIDGGFIKAGLTGDYRFGDNFITYKTGTTVCRMDRIYKTDEVTDFFEQAGLIISGLSSHYGFDADYLIGLYNDDNSPKWELVAADLTEIEDELQPWQYTNINSNEFKPSDIPDYPEPEGDDQWGNNFWLINNNMPLGSANGFLTQYCLTAKHLGAFGHYLWAEFFDSDFWESILVVLGESGSINPSDILNYIPCIRYFPFDLDDMSNFHSTGSNNIYIGRGTVPIEVVTSPSKSVGVLTSYADGVSCISNVIEPVFNDFRDYEPCTRLVLFVPFCGIIELTPSQVMGRQIILHYMIDFSTGACSCAVSVTDGNGIEHSVLSILDGNIAAEIQLTASNLSQVMQSFGKAALGIAGTVALATIGIGEASTAEAVGGHAAQAEGTLQGTGKSMLSGMSNNINSLLSLSGVPQPYNGSSGGFSTFINTQPIIQRTIRYYAIPSNYAHVYGYACNKTVTLSELEGKGFTVCKNVDMHGFPATQDELSEIESLLTSGVYF